MNWIIENLGTLGVGLVVLIMIGTVIFILIRDKRRNKNLTCNCCQNLTGNCRQDFCDEEHP